MEDCTALEVGTSPADVVEIAAPSPKIAPFVPPRVSWDRFPSLHSDMLNEDSISGNVWHSTDEAGVSSIIQDVRRSATHPSCSDASAEPVAPTSTMAHFLSSSGAGSRHPFAIRSCNGIISTAAAASSNDQSIPPYMFSASSWSKHADELIVPRNDVSFPWNIALKDSACRLQWMSGGSPAILQNSSSFSPIAMDVSSPPLTQQQENVHHESLLNAQASCSTCSLNYHFSASPTTPSWNEVFRRTARYHNTVSPFWGVQHPDATFVSPDANNIDASSPFQVPHLGADEINKSIFLVCRNGHTCCASCLLTCWISYAAATFNTNGMENLSQFCRLACPCQGCDASYSMNKFWRFIYSRTVYACAYHLANETTPHLIRPFSHADLQWFYTVWFPIVYISKSHWRRATSQPESFCWLPNGIAPIHLQQSDVNSRTIVIRKCEWPWRLLNNAPSTSTATAFRMMNFGVAERANLVDTSRGLSLPAYSSSSGIPRSAAASTAESDIPADSLERDIRDNVNQWLAFIDEGLMVVFSGAIVPVPNSSASNKWEPEAMFFSEAALETAVADLPVAAEQTSLHRSLLRVMDFCDRNSVGVDFEKFSDDCLAPFTTEEGVLLSSSSERYHFMLQPLPLQSPKEVNSLSPAPHPSSLSTRRSADVASIVECYHRLCTWYASLSCPYCGHAPTSSTPSVVKNRSSSSSSTPSLNHSSNALVAQCSSCEIQWCVHCRRMTFTTAAATASSTKDEHWKRFYLPVTCTNPSECGVHHKCLNAPHCGLSEQTSPWLACALCPARKSMASFLDMLLLSGTVTSTLVDHKPNDEAIVKGSINDYWHCIQTRLAAKGWPIHLLYTPSQC